MSALPPATAAIFTSYLYHSLGARHAGTIRRQPRPPTQPPDGLDARIAAIVDAPPPPGECARFAATRKEAELLTLFATLTVSQSRTLHARLWHPASADPLARVLARLGPERKQRLVLFLGRHRAYR